MRVTIPVAGGLPMRVFGGLRLPIGAGISSIKTSPQGQSGIDCRWGTLVTCCPKGIGNLFGRKQRDIIHLAVRPTTDNSGLGSPPTTDNSGRHTRLTFMRLSKNKRRTLKGRCVFLTSSLPISSVPVINSNGWNGGRERSVPFRPKATKNGRIAPGPRDGQIAALPPGNGHVIWRLPDQLRGSRSR